MAWPVSGAGTLPSVRANSTAASNTFDCGAATASMRPALTSADTIGLSPW